MNNDNLKETQEYLDFLNISGDEERLVAMLDIMGFKSIVQSKSSDEIYELFCKVDMKKMITEKYLSPIWTMIFSDTIIIVTKSAGNSDLYALIVASIMYQRLFFDNGYALNGGISKGKVRVDKDKNILFGKPIIDAHILQEKLFYYGIAFAPEMSTYLDNILSLNSVVPGCKQPIIKQKIPIKTKNDKSAIESVDWKEYYHLNYTELWGISSIKDFFTPTDSKKCIQKCLEKIGNYCETTRAKQYLSNTRQVFNL